MAKVKDNSAYPYVTVFKKKPFRSFTFAIDDDIGSFFIPEYDKIVKIYRFFEKKLLNFRNLNLENIYWFLLLGKYLREDISINLKKIINFITGCEIFEENSLGFKFSPESKQRKPDNWSTFFALASLNLLGQLDAYLSTHSRENIKEKIINFIYKTRDKGRFIHCLNKNCTICQKTTPIRTSFFVIEALILLDFDIKLEQNVFLKYFNDLKKKYSIVFQLLSLKYFDLISDIETKHLKYLHQFQQNDGGFSFKENVGKINETFWIIYVLENYSWFFDYNRGKIYSFLSTKIKGLNHDYSSFNTLKLMDISKIILMCSFIWSKFIEEVERTAFRHFDINTSLDLNILKKELGINEGIPEILRHINQKYNFNLEILDNEIEFNNYLRNLTRENAYLAKSVYASIKNNSVIYLNKLLNDYKYNYPNKPKKIRDLILLTEDLISHNFFLGRILRKNMIFFSKYYLYKDKFISEVIRIDSNINSEEIINEKFKLEEIKTDIYNIIIKLKDTPKKIKEEIKSLILVNEFDLARERLKYNVKNALMEADFLNENIENSFSTDFKYINPNYQLSNEIVEWNKNYSEIRGKYFNLQNYFNEIFKEKENLKNFKLILNKLEDLIDKNEQKIYSLIDHFKNLFRESLEKSYSNGIVQQLLKVCEHLNSEITKLDTQIYKISHKITSKEKSIQKTQKKVISKWISIKEDADTFIDYFLEGFKIYENDKNEIKEIEQSTSMMINELKNTVDLILKEKKYQLALEIIEEKTEKLLNEKLELIKKSQSQLKEHLKSKRKLFLLLKKIQEDWNKLEQKIIEKFDNYRNSIEDKVIQERELEKLKEFDNFIKSNISILEEQLRKKENECAKDLNYQKLKIANLKSRIAELSKNYSDLNEKVKDKVKELAKIVVDFQEKSKLCMLSWNKFIDLFKNNLNDLKNRYTNEIIKQEILSNTSQSHTNLIKLDDLKKKLNLKCNILIERINEMIEITKLDGELDENNKELLVFTDNYYKNKQLRNFIEKQIEKLGNNFGKLVSLYESAIKNKSLKVNVLEIQNRIEEFNNQQLNLERSYQNEILKIGINTNRDDFIANKNFFNTELNRYRNIINEINKNTIIFNQLVSFIGEEFNSLRIQLRELNKLFQDEAEKINDYDKLINNFSGKILKLSETRKISLNEIEQKISTMMVENESLKISNSEIREELVFKKHQFNKEFEEFKENLSKKLDLIKNDALKEDLMHFINRNQVILNQMLGSLERKVEDKLEIKDFKSTSIMVQRRVKKIRERLKYIENETSKLKKEFKKSSPTFNTKNKFLFDDFKHFLHEYDEIINEKIKKLEQLILKSYVKIVIKAVKDEYITISFLARELKIKKDKIQTYIITLIGENALPGKYDPELQLYYENPEIIDSLNPAKLKVIKTTNFKFYEILNRLRFVASQYGSVISLIAALFTISLALNNLTGGNPLAVFFPLIITVVIILYLLLRKQKEEKI